MILVWDSFPLVSIEEMDRMAESWIGVVNMAVSEVVVVVVVEVAVMNL